MPLYRALAQQISAAIDAGRLEPGLVLLEGPLSTFLNASRATVRNALARLEEEGRIGKFGGRGFVVAGDRDDATPIRREVTARDVHLNGAAPVGTKAASDQIIREVENALSVAVAFGHYRINEQRLAENFSVSRPVAREVLWRLREAGLVEKDHHSPWLAGPLTARAVAEDRELRMLLEPHALKMSAPLLDGEELRTMRGRVAAARDVIGRIDADAIDLIEADLHESCLQFFGNSRVWGILHNGRMPLRVNALFARFVGIESDDPGLTEHRVVLDQIIGGEFDAAAASHMAHLRLEGRRTLDRLKVLSVIPEPPLPDYLERIE